MRESNKEMLESLENRQMHICDQSKKRYDNIDILKTISIFMVILLHTLTWKTNFLENENFKTYATFFTRILCEGVPIFVLVNGFLIINKEFSFKKHLKKILNIFIVLMIWSVIDIIAIKLILGESIQIKEIVKNIFLTDINNQYTGPLWFLQSLITLYIMFPVLKVLHDNNKKVYNYFFIIVTVFTVGLSLINNILLIVDSKLKIDLCYYFNTFFKNYNPIRNGSFIFYFMLGGYLFEKREVFEKRKNRLIMFLIGIISWIAAFALAILISKTTGKQVASNFNYSSIFMAAMMIGLYAITYKYVNKNHFYNKMIMDIGKNTLGIYLIHKILTIAGLSVIKQNSYSQNLLFSIIIFITSYVLVKMIKKIPIIKKMIEI